MFMSFGERPRILRFFCRSTVFEYDHPAFPELVHQIAKGKREAFDGARAVIVADIWQVQTSCGFGVPRVKKGIYAPNMEAPPMSVEEVLRQGCNEKIDELAIFEERPNMDSYAAGQVQKNIVLDYHNMNNLTSLDGLPGLKTARRNVGQTLWVTNVRARAKRILAEGEAVAAGFCLAIFLYFSLVRLGVLS